MPTQVVDDDAVQCSSETILCEKHQMVVLAKLQRATGDTSTYLQYEEKELYYKRELRSKDIQHKMELQSKDDTISRVTEQYAQLLRKNLLRSHFKLVQY